LKQYVTHELRVEPKGREYRGYLIRTCCEALATSTRHASARKADELQLLRMVDLTQFVLDACDEELSDMTQKLQQEVQTSAQRTTQLQEGQARE
jgi:hypothetical protein